MQSKISEKNQTNIYFKNSNYLSPILKQKCRGATILENIKFNTNPFRIFELLHMDRQVTDEYRKIPIVTEPKLRW
jgi:hypothetical protein